MSSSYSIFFMSGDSKLRATLTSEFSSQGWQIVPCENFAEIAAHPADHAVLLCAVENAAEIAAIDDQMERSGDWLPIISCSPSADGHLVAEAIHAGSQSHLPLPVTVEQLARAIHACEERMIRHIERRKARYAARRRLEPLSPRERDVLEALARLGSNKKIALELDISPRTVEIYRSKIMQRLGVEHMAQALWLAFQSENFTMESIPLRS